MMAPAIAMRKSSDLTDWRTYDNGPAMAAVRPEALWPLSARKKIGVGDRRTTLYDSEEDYRIQEAPRDVRTAGETKEAVKTVRSSAPHDTQEDISLHYDAVHCEVASAT